MVTSTSKDSHSHVAPAASAGAEERLSDPKNVPFELVQYLETDRDLKARRDRTLGIIMQISGMLLGLAAILTVMVMIPHLSDTEYVIFEKEESTGDMRIAQRLDAPFTPDERVREHFIALLVQHIETFDRPTVDWSVNILRHFVKRDLLDRYQANMHAINETIGATGKRLVWVGPVLPITEHKSGQSYNQSTIDFKVTIHKRDGNTEVRPMVAIMTYRFVPYTKAELESSDKEIKDKIRKNPLGMEVSDYRVDSKTPADQPNK